MFPKYRGKQVLMRDENGLEKCVACGLCAVACPADAIYLEAAENDGTRAGRAALRVDLPDSQDALHLLRLLRRGLPGVGHLHGQGLRAGRLQQQGLHLGQGGPARPGRRHRRARCDVRVSSLAARRCRGFSKRSTERVLVCDGAMGTHALREGHLPQPLLRRAEPHPARSRRRGASRLRARRRRRHRDEHVRRQSLQARELRSGRRERARINAQGARIARHAARDAAWVAGSIGPLGVRIEPWGRTGVDEAEAAFREQAAALARGRRRSLHPRDVPRSERARRRDSRGAHACRRCRSSRR